MACPKCGNDDPTEILADIVRVDRRTAHFHGWECTKCWARWKGAMPSWKSEKVKGKAA